MQQASHVDAPSDPGVWAIPHALTRTCDVGAFANLAEHVATPVHLLSIDTHGRGAVQAAWNTEGEAAFEFTVLELITHLARLPACER